MVKSRAACAQRPARDARAASGDEDVDPAQLPAHHPRLVLPCSSRPSGPLRNLRERKPKKGPRKARRANGKADLEELKEKVTCAAVLETAGFASTDGKHT